MRFGCRGDRGGAAPTLWWCWGDRGSAAMVVDKNGNREKQKEFNAMMGMASSLLENIMPEQIFSSEEQPVEGISAAKALMLASQQGQKIYRITADNITSILASLTIDAQVKADINNAIAAGLQATVHEAPVNVGSWTGTGYILTDPETGAGAYRISGGANGGWTDIAGLITPVLTFWKTWDVAAWGNQVTKFSKALGVIGSMIGVLSFAAETFDKCNNLANKILIMGMMMAFFAIITSVTTAFAANPLGTILFSMTANFIVSKFMIGVRSIACQ
jgi:hypothetical protein